MTMFLITLPLMIAAVAIAVVPVLYHSIREHRLIHTGSPTRTSPKVDSGYSVRPARPAEPEKVAA
jgi:hypothetical protein